MDASEYLINCLKMNQTNNNFSNMEINFEEFPDEKKNENKHYYNSDAEFIIRLIENIRKKEEIDKSLFELSKQRENFKDIAVYIYYSTGTMSLLYFCFFNFLSFFNFF